MSAFAQRLIDWHRRHGRHDLPWQRDWQQRRDPYPVWLSEIMLQQTQVTTVIPYYERFLVRFPTLAALAEAPVEEVMALWSGLGYYARARNLHRCAQTVMREHGGDFPRDPAALAALPGIGRSTANAIAAFCFGAHVPILDGNVKRLLCRFLGVEGFPGSSGVESRLWQDAVSLLPAGEVATYIQAQMDMGATLCTRSRPRCDLCPVAADCVARATGRTGDLPVPRPKKAVPERQVTLLVLRADNRMLLERRPPAGIWGGLLSLPELPAGEDAALYCRQRLGIRIGAVSPAPTFTHGFTHFRLAIRPLRCTAETQPRTMEPGLCWLDAAELAQAALPAPIRKILSATA
ncbi:MAG: A/G-specific adenine glycosylase [Rhodocyclaceae bacterium]|jgi:A/G-specific adenine glycosylase|nr:A/G-specific adenine glycosylase [Rhodocyclaceae bacterium]